MKLKLSALQIRLGVCLEDGGCRKGAGLRLGEGWELIVRGLGTDKEKMGAGKEKVAPNGMSPFCLRWHTL